MVPDKTIRWETHHRRSNVFHLAPQAPPDALQLLREPPKGVGSLIGEGAHGKAYRVIGTDYVVKEVDPPPQHMDKQRHSRVCGFAALQLNVALETGIKRLGPGATLPNGTELTTPQYHGVMLGSAIRILMSFESGGGVYQGDSRAGTHLERRAIFDAALGAVGMKPPNFYDDVPTNRETNLLARWTNDDRQQVVMLDASPLF
jgi:hypothetical protein